jgi:hypothetical protein
VDWGGLLTAPFSFEGIMRTADIKPEVIEFAIRCGYVTTGYGFANGRCYVIESLLEHGVERLKEMVIEHTIGLEPAARYARDKSAEEQNIATTDAMHRYYAESRIARKVGKSKPSKESQRNLWRQQRNEAAINAALRIAAKPKVTDEQFERPPPELLDQQYPGREPGVTYAHVHREQHGRSWHNVQKRRRYELERKLKELAADLEKALVDVSILDPSQIESVRKRWRITAQRMGELIGSWADLPGDIDAGHGDEPVEARRSHGA